MPDRYTCVGVNESPSLTWSGAPDKTKTLALIVVDPDAPSGNFIHWTAFNIPRSISKLPQSPAGSESVGGEQGTNGKGEIGYTGPCPPPGSVHHYHFRLFALDRNLPLGGHPDAAQIEAAMRGHVLASTELTGTYSR